MYYGITVKSESSQDWESFRRTLQSDSSSEKGVSQRDLKEKRL